MEAQFDFKVIEGDGSTYLGMLITNVPNEIIQEWGNFGGANALTCLTLSSNNYEGEIRDITISPGRAKKVGELRLMGIDSH